MKNLELILEKVREESAKLGFKLTEKRQNILILLLQTRSPLSAYDISDQYKNTFGTSIPTMSVYRILDSLLEVNFAHKLKTTSQYLACSHITCNHEHGIPQFLICNKCHLISEIGARNKLIAELETSIENTGFLMENKQLELYGVCVSCK